MYVLTCMRSTHIRSLPSLLHSSEHAITAALIRSLPSLLHPSVACHHCCTHPSMPSLLHSYTHANKPACPQLVTHRIGLSGRRRCHCCRSEPRAHQPLLPHSPWLIGQALVGWSVGLGGPAPAQSQRCPAQIVGCISAFKYFQTWPKVGMRCLRGHWLWSTLLCACKFGALTLT